MRKIPIKFTRLVVSASLLLLAGCNFPGSGGSKTATPAATPSPLQAGTDENCLIGVWELADFSDSIQSMIPSNTIVYKGTNGRMRWTFTAGGIVEAESDNFSISLAEADDPSSIVTILTNGTARRFYDINSPGLIAFTNPDDSEFTYTGVVNGVTVDLAPLLKSIAPVPPASGTISYQCQGNSLTVFPAASGALPLGFVKVGL